MLQVASPAFLIIRAGRISSFGVACYDLGKLAEQEVLFPLLDVYNYCLIGQCMAHHNDLAVIKSAEAISAVDYFGYMDRGIFHLSGSEAGVNERSR